MAICAFDRNPDCDDDYDDDDGRGFGDILDRATACDQCGAIGPVYLCGASVRCGRCAGIYEEQNHE